MNDIVHVAREINLEREIRFEPGYDYTEEDAKGPPGKARGVHGLQIRWLLKGEDGTVQFLLYTDWLPTDVEAGPWGPIFSRRKREERAQRSPSMLAGMFPMCADLGYHWRWPTYEDQAFHGECDALKGGGDCYYDGSGMAAEKVGALMVVGGSDAVWTHLQDYYYELQHDANELRFPTPKALPVGPPALTEVCDANDS